MYALSKLSLKRLEGVHPKLSELFKRAISNSPHDFMVVQGLRTAEYQKGYTHKSNHQAKSDGYGHAVDFAIYDPTIPGNIDWDNNKKYKEVAEHLKKVAEEMKINIEWGGDWRKFKDYPHIELK